ncbi:acetyl-CoA hydrolase/transferase C-terminal domain-containing protein [Escherichia coli]
MQWDRVGTRYVQINPKKIVAVVETNLPDAGNMLDKQNPMCQQIADNVVTFLLQEMAHGRIAPQILPLQSGVGNINNAVMARLRKPGNSSVNDVFGSATGIGGAFTGNRQNQRGQRSSLTILSHSLRKIYDNMDYFASRIVLRPQEISNDPEIIRRLGVIALNVGLEFEYLPGMPTQRTSPRVDLMNGIGGSGDFERNAYLSIFMAPSIAKEGKISTVVPMCSHVNHGEDASSK